MLSSRKSLLFLRIVLLLLPALACETATLVSAGAKVDCEAKGGIWKQEVGADGEVTEWCETPPQVATPTASAIVPSSGTTPLSPAETKAECVVPADSYTWSYLDSEQDSGTGGVACSARFVFTNSGSDPLNLIVYSAWDNNQMQFSGWKIYLVKPGATWEEQVSRTIYKDGDVTFSVVNRLLVIRDIPACRKLLAGDNEVMWEQTAVTIDEFTCPLQN